MPAVTLPTVTLWYDAECPRSQKAKELLEQVGAPVVVFDYLREPPDPIKLAALLERLKKKPSQVVKRKSDRYRNLQLKDADDSAVLAALSKYPELIDGPIATTERDAVLARPTALILRLLIPELPNGVDANEALRRAMQGRISE